MKKLLEMIVALLGGMNESRLNAIFQAAGVNQTLVDLKGTAIKNLDAEDRDADIAIEDATKTANEAEEVYNERAKVALAEFEKAKQTAAKARNQITSATAEKASKAKDAKKEVAKLRKQIG